MNQPNRPCECGSGKKQKKCHPNGAPMYGPWPKPKDAQQIRKERSNAATSMLLFSAMEIMAMRSIER